MHFINVNYIIRVFVEDDSTYIEMHSNRKFIVADEPYEDLIKRIDK